ncbi:hypothetical protein TNCV_1452401 [Trichonephila clavipes]|nr:hypothetical protein TNCV_1452401 [Trichonephila clavipes]
MIGWALKLSEFNIGMGHAMVFQNVAHESFIKKSVDSVEGSQISCATLEPSRQPVQQFIKEQKILNWTIFYRYLENLMTVLLMRLCESQVGHQTYENGNVPTQSNLTERVNRNLVQMIASFVEENQEKLGPISTRVRFRIAHSSK